ncbi:MAG: DUF2391 domain-containing protein [Halobacteriota archaeon]
MDGERVREISDYDVDDVLRHLENLSEDVDSEEYRSELDKARRMLANVPGTRVINKYTTRDMGEAFVGGLLFSMPMLVEDGVFGIAEWFLSFWVAGVPVLFVVNAVLVGVVTAGLLYAVDIREIVITKPLFGVLPRRLVGVLGISFLTAGGALFLWGRLHSGDPSTLEMVARVSVVWSVAALGAVLADILPGESKGQDVSDLVDIPGIEG